MACPSAVLLTLAALCAVGSSSILGWRMGSVYEYTVHTRTLTGLDNAAAQFAGVLTRARLRLQVDEKNSSQLNAQIEESVFAELRDQLPGGWASPAPDNLTWRPLTLQHNTFAMHMNHGQIKGFLVNSDTSLWEMNYLSGLANSLQVVVGGDSVIKSSKSQAPQSNASHALYSVKEISLLGKCVVDYDVSPLTAAMIVSQQNGSPETTVNKNSNFIQIVKTVNFERCSSPVMYYGGSVEPSGNGPENGDHGPVRRSATTRVIGVGPLGNMELHSAIVTGRVSAGPLLRGDGPQAAVWSRVNVTLQKIEERPPSPLSVPAHSVSVPLSSFSSLYMWSKEQNVSQILDGTIINAMNEKLGDEEQKESAHSRHENSKREEKSDWDDTPVPSWNANANSNKNNGRNIQSKPYMKQRRMMGSMKQPRMMGYMKQPRMMGYTKQPRMMGYNSKYEKYGYRLMKRSSMKKMKTIRSPEYVEKLLDKLMIENFNMHSEMKNSMKDEMLNSPRFKRVDTETNNPAQVVNRTSYYLPSVMNSSESDDSSDFELPNTPQDSPTPKQTLNNVTTVDLTRFTVKDNQPQNPQGILRYIYKNIWSDDSKNFGTKFTRATSHKKPTSNGTSDTTHKPVDASNSAQMPNESFGTSHKENGASNTAQMPNESSGTSHKDRGSSNTPNAPPDQAQTPDDTTGNNENEKLSWWDKFKNKMSKVKDWFHCPKPFVKECKSDEKPQEEKEKRHEGANFMDSDDHKRREDLDGQAAAALEYDPDFHGVQELCPSNMIMNILNSIARDMHDPQSLMQGKALLLFNDLVRMLRGCLHAPLRKISDMIPEPRSSAWKVFRDAVAQSGTGPGLLEIHEWLTSDRLDNWESRQLLGTLASTVRRPTPAYLAHFFMRFVNDSSVNERSGVNASAVLTFSTLVRSAYASGLRVDGYVAYMARKLLVATASQDSHATQVFIRALGKTGHPMVLQAFRPYLNGKIPHCTTFHRLAMMFALQKVAQLNPALTRPVLFNVLKNRGEVTEVRTAALYILMTARPSLTMLRRVAVSARGDSVQMESAIVSALHSAAALTAPGARPLARAAKSVLASLPRRSRGLHRSRSLLSDLYSNPQGPGYSRAFNYIGSHDEILPKMVYLGSTGRLGGLNLGTSQFAALVSSMNKFRVSLSNTLPENTQLERDFEDDDYVNLGPRRNEPLEGHILFPLAGTQHFITFDTKSIFNFTLAALSGVVEFATGKKMNLSKLYFGPRYHFAVPDVTGHMNFFTFDSPAVLRVMGNMDDFHDRIKANVTDGKVVEALLTGYTLNMSFTWAQTFRGRMGFVCPFSAQSHRFQTAVDQYQGLSIPLHATVGAMVPENAKLEQQAWEVIHLQPSNDQPQTLVNFKKRTFTSKQAAGAHETDPENEVEIIQSRDMTERLWSFGPHNALLLNVTSESEFMNLDQLRRDHAGYDLWSLMSLPIVQTTAQNMHAKLTLDPKAANIQSVIIPLQLIENEKKIKFPNFGENEDSKREKNNNDEHIHQNKSDIVFDFLSGDRHYVINSGIMTFYEDKLVSHLVHGEFSMNSAVNKEKYVLQYLNSESPYGSQQSETNSIQKEMDLSVEKEWGESPLWFFNEAMTADPTSQATAKLEYMDRNQPKMHVNIKCEMSRTRNRASFLPRVGEARVCTDQMAHGNFLLPACTNVTLRAGHLDRYDCEAHYQHLNPAWVNGTAAALGVAQLMFTAHASVNPLHRGPANQASLMVQYEPTFYGVNVSLRTPSLAVAFNEIPNTRNARPVLVAHPALGLSGRVAQYLFNYQNDPYCVLDKTAVNTFDNTTYPVQLGSCWYNVSVFQNQHMLDQNITLQARDAGESRILRIIFGPGNHLEVQNARKSGRSKRNQDSNYAGTMSLNGQEIEVTKNSRVVVPRNHQFSELVMVSKVSKEMFQLRLIDYNIRILFDGLRVVVHAPNSLRAHTRGLCGTFTGEQSDDFEDPDGYLQSDPRLFAASYANVHENCQGHVKEDNERSKTEPRFQAEIMLYDVVGNAGSDLQSMMDDSQARAMSGWNGNQPGNFVRNTRDDLADSADSSDNTYSNVPSNMRDALPPENVNKERDMARQSRFKMIEDIARMKNGARNAGSSSCSPLERMDVVVNETHHCFSQKPLLTCGNGCHEGSIERLFVPYHCISGSSGPYWLSLVEKGMKPNFGHKKTHVVWQKLVPTSCVRAHGNGGSRNLK